MDLSDAGLVQPRRDKHHSGARGRRDHPAARAGQLAGPLQELLQPTISERE